MDFTVAVESQALEELAIVLVHQEVTREGLQRVLTMQEDDSIPLEQEVLRRGSSTTTTATNKVGGQKI